MDFWAEVGLAAAIATALATGVSTLAGLWWRRMDRAYADWAVLRGRSWWTSDRRNGDPDGPNASATLANVGDGLAFRVSVQGEGCNAYFVKRTGHDIGPMWTRLEFAPVAKPGQDMVKTLSCARSATSTPGRKPL